jgi:hypothetical protein
LRRAAQADTLQLSAAEAVLTNGKLGARCKLACRFAHAPYFLELHILRDLFLTVQLGHFPVRPRSFGAEGSERIDLGSTASRDVAGAQRGYGQHCSYAHEGRRIVGCDLE